MSKQVTIQIIITEHAFARSKERMGFDEKATKRMAIKAFVAGIRHKQMPIKLKRYVTEKFSSKGTCNNIRIYGEAVWLFADNTLVTLYQLPNELKPLAKK